MYSINYRTALKVNKKDISYPQVINNCLEFFMNLDKLLFKYPSG